MYRVNTQGVDERMVNVHSSSSSYTGAKHNRRFLAQSSEQLRPIRTSQLIFRAKSRKSGQHVRLAR